LQPNQSAIATYGFVVDNINYIRKAHKPPTK